MIWAHACIAWGYFWVDFSDIFALTISLLVDWMHNPCLSLTFARMLFVDSQRRKKDKRKRKWLSFWICSFSFFNRKAEQLLTEILCLKKNNMMIMYVGKRYWSSWYSLTKNDYQFDLKNPITMSWCFFSAENDCPCGSTWWSHQV